MFYRFVKRGFDLFNSLLAMIVLSPLFLFISIGIKASSRGPVFYISERIGKNGIPFRMLKFRSMHIKQEGSVESKYLVNEQRIFGFGRFLRKSKLDELPQIINIFLGNMSVVGPRPYPKRFTDSNYGGDYAEILTVRPGLACFDSLYDYAHGELFVTDEKQYAEQVIPIRTELARMYVRKAGIMTDLFCIFRTLQLMIEIVLLKKKSFSLTKTEIEARDRVRLIVSS